MGKWIFTRRYNWVDAGGIAWAVHFLVSEQWLAALAVVLVGSCISVTGERFYRTGPHG